jgi:hypothetical protein
MTNKIGRNDPCWCGSGKKLKKCHGTQPKAPSSPQGFRVKPSKTPPPITTHMVQIGNKLVERPGLLAIRLNTQPLESVDQQLNALKQQWIKALGSSSSNQAINESVLKRLKDIEHKTLGVRYHRNNYLQHEQNLIKRFTTDHNPPTGVEMEDSDPQLIYEVEGFLYQTKSCLDMLAQLLRVVGYQSVGDSFGEHGERIIKQLENPPRHCTEQAKIIVKLITDAQSAWIDEAVNLRDSIAHQGMMAGFNYFIQQPYVGGGTGDIRYPTMPNGERVSICLDRVEKLLIDFVDHFVIAALASLRTNA